MKMEITYPKQEFLKIVNKLFSDNGIIPKGCNIFTVESEGYPIKAFRIIAENTREEKENE